MYKDYFVKRIPRVYKQFIIRLTDIADEGTRLELLKKLVHSWPVFTLRGLLGALLIHFVNVGLL